MELLEAIFTRRSSRRFRAQKIEAKDLDILLQAAMNAPSARNEQPWHFLIVTEKEVLEKMPTIHPHAQMCRQAPMAIIPCFNADEYKYDDTLWALDLAACTQNILLAARGQNLGAVWVAIYPKEERINSMRNLLELPEKVIPFCIIPVGYTDVPQERTNRFNEDRIHFNHWQSEKKL